jgi:hypothetical protein
LAHLAVPSIVDHNVLRFQVTEKHALVVDSSESAGNATNIKHGNFGKERCDGAMHARWLPKRRCGVDLRTIIEQVPQFATLDEFNEHVDAILVLRAIREQSSRSAA